MARKRAGQHPPDDGDHPIVKRRRQPPRAPFSDAPAVVEEARRCLLGVARLPLQCLDATWTDGLNRPLDERRVRELVAIFRRGGLRRHARENFLRVQCSEAAFRAMAAASDAAGGEDDVRDFRAWPSTHGDLRLELLAGQHRAVALRRYVQETELGDEGELWWPCEVYNQGRCRRYRT